MAKNDHFKVLVINLNQPTAWDVLIPETLLFVWEEQVSSVGSLVFYHLHTSAYYSILYWARHCTQHLHTLMNLAEHVEMIPPLHLTLYWPMRTKHSSFVHNLEVLKEHDFFCMISILTNEVEWLTHDQFISGDISANTNVIRDLSLAG